ncbi:MAG: archaeal proteasome endopeptidase complex subunit beta [Crenarchaeota archaeon]|nr:archaeal proteasome endopeptidase complex subunit beta [Thermoproteota archaeon]
MELYELLSGTAVGIRAQDGVVLASERRVAYGFYLLSKSGRKIFKINDRVGIAAAGVLADMQTIARIVRADMNLYYLRTRRVPAVKSVAKLLSILLFEHRLIPYICEVVVGGIDDEGPHIYVLDPAGSLIEDDYTALGTGAKIAIGILESEYRKDMTVKEAKELAVKAIRQAVSRDPVSGDGCDLLIITREGTREETVQF